MAETSTPVTKPATAAENNGGDPKGGTDSTVNAVSTSEQVTQTAKTESVPIEKSPEKTAERRFSQSEVDEIISKRLARESKNAEKAENTAKENETLRQSLACYKAGVKDDCIDDAVTLAKKLVNDKTDFSAALKKVIEKYPSFTGKDRATGVQMGDKSFSSSDADLRKAFGLKAK